MKKEHLYWIFQIGGWSVYALINIVVGPLATSEQLSFPELILFLSEAFFFLMVTHAYRSIIIRYGWLRINITGLIFRVLVATAIIGFVVFCTRIMVSYILNVFDEQLYAVSNIFGHSLSNALIAFFWSLLYFIYHYFERFNISLKYEAAVNEMQLNQLKSQLNPHFIFNALNSIRALVDENPSKSKTAITALSNILRNSLAADKKRLIDFNDEMKTVKDYLDLESIRYEERLRMDILIDPESERFSVPPLMIQTLVENGIKHGISNLKDGGKIGINTQVHDSYLKIQIRNSGQLKNGALFSPVGYGLKNTRDRLKLIYGDKASFKINNEDNTTVLTEITIPQTI